MAINPARVMTIEMTKASRGRSTKMAEITGSPSLGRACRRGLHHLARPHFLHAVDDDLLAFLEPGLDDDIGLLLGAGLDAPDLGLVVAANDEHVAAGLVDLERCLRDDEARQLRARRWRRPQG